MLFVSMMVMEMPATAAAATEWAQFHADNSNSGYSSDEAPDTNNTLWINSTAGSIPGFSPIIVNIKVYLNCNEIITAFNVNNGEYNGGHSGLSDGYVQGTPAYDGNYLCLISYEYDWSTKGLE